MSSSERRRGRDEDGTLRPWELPGRVRRDCEPHRGGLLMGLGMAALVCGFAAVVLVFPAVVALALGFVAVRLAGRDLERMRSGEMDPEGRRQAVRALAWGWVAVLLGLLGWVPLVVLLYLSRP